VTAGGSGTRARSREFGYAEAMRDISRLLDREARKWKNSAEQQLSAEWRAALKVAADELRKVGDYAHTVSVAYELPDLGEFLAETVWHPRYGGSAAPHETGSFPAV
jgi:hypothetical protein